MKDTMIYLVLLAIGFAVGWGIINAIEGRPAFRDLPTEEIEYRHPTLNELLERRERQLRDAKLRLGKASSG